MGPSIDDQFVYPGVPALVVEAIDVKVRSQAGDLPVLADQLVVPDVAVLQSAPDGGVKTLALDRVMDRDLLDNRLHQRVVGVFLVLDLAQEAADPGMIFREYSDGIRSAGLLEPDGMAPWAAVQVAQMVNQHARHARVSKPMGRSGPLG